MLLAGGLVGALASFVLAVEKIALLGDPDYLPSCSLDAVVSCGSIMTTPQAEVFGFPNPLLGVAAFPAVAVIGAVMLARTQPARWLWWGVQFGALGGVVFIHWLAFQSLYRIEALCPYCMVVWAVTITIFWYVTLRTLTDGFVGSRAERLGCVLAQWHGAALTLWFLGIAALVVTQFYDHWISLLV